ncbi:MAG: hypothetical protein Q8R02_11460 [Hyphomonadaceae bacterium]|nr:hypothetical protein [Hyphomonadaceae bacterium]
MERSLRLFLVSAGLLLTSPAIAQQAVTDTAQLVLGVSCTSAAEARIGLESAVSRSLQGSADDAVIAALNQISADASVCSPARDAATELSNAIVDASASAAIREIAVASGSIVGVTLAEADRRAANLKFKVGPPPRNMTKGREGP